MDEELILLLSKLVFQGKEKQVKGILEDHIKYPDIDLNCIDPFNGETLLTGPVHFSDRKLFRLLVEHGICIDTKNEDQTTALMKAAGRGHLPMMEELLLFDANVHEIDRVGNNALCYAAITGKMKTIHYLVFEAGISLCDHDYTFTPVVCANNAKQLEVLTFFKELSLFQSIAAETKSEQNLT